MTARADIIGERVTLDGRPAVIAGHPEPWLVTVATLPNGPSYVWAVLSVARIVARGGRFHS